MTPRRGLVWPLLLIAFGLVFLAANFGFIGPVSVAALLSLWPLILILVGIDIAIGRRWPVVALDATAAVIAVGIALVTLNPTTTAGIFPFSVGGQAAHLAERACTYPIDVDAKIESTKRIFARIGRHGCAS